MKFSILALTLAAFAGLTLITPTFAMITTKDTFGSGGNAFTMDFVTVGSPVKSLAASPED